MFLSFMSGEEKNSIPLFLEEKKFTISIPAVRACSAPCSHRRCTARRQRYERAHHRRAAAAAQLSCFARSGLIRAPVIAR